jgi:hypothetical protein
LSSVILYFSHYVHETIGSRYKKIHQDCANQFDFCLLYDNSRDDVSKLKQQCQGIDIYPFCSSELNDLAYPGKSLISIVPGNAELAVLKYFQSNPQYDYYWVVEYDVCFSGSWNDLFSYFAANQADLLATTIFRHDFAPHWNHWKSLKPAGCELENRDRLRAFMPIYRISNAALRQLHNEYQKGWSGHFECTVPTILNFCGLKIEDIGGDGEFVAAENINRFYRNTPFNKNLSPGTFVYRPKLRRLGNEQNILWHPVKPD